MERGIMAEKELPQTDNPPELLKPDDFFDKYRIVSFIGRGGMSEVYLAEHLLLKQFCALKIMTDPTGGRDPEIFQRFLREARCFYSLEHPGIVRVFDVGCDSKTGWLFIVMEYLEGQTLAEYCVEPLPAGELLRIVSDMADALEELEKKQIVHRDIKPSNIMRCKDGRYKLMDLGIAKAAGELFGDHTLTLGNAVFGTPAYASPEQCHDPHRADIRSDIYSLGCTLYHLSCGKLPYDGKTPVETIINVISGKPVPLEKIRKNLPRPVVELIKCMMDKAPEKRPQNVAELKELIRKAGQVPADENLIIRGRWRLAVCAILISVIAGVTSYTYLAVKKVSGDRSSVAENIPAAPAAVCHDEEVEEDDTDRQEPEKIEVPAPSDDEENEADTEPAPASNKTQPPARKCAFVPIAAERINYMIRHWVDAHSGMDNWRAAPWPSWQTHLGFAGVQAQEENKMLLIFFCDSRVLPESFEDEKLSAFLRENFILLFIDFNFAGMEQSQRKHIATVRNLFNNNRWPISIVVTAAGEHIATIPGFPNHLEPLYSEILNELLQGRRVHFDSRNRYIRPELSVPSDADQGDGQDL